MAGFRRFRRKVKKLNCSVLREHKAGLEISCLSGFDENLLSDFNILLFASMWVLPVKGEFLKQP
jgi:hypothetical protein